MIEIPISPEMKASIVAESEKRGELNSSTLIKGIGNRAGFGGELLFMHHFPTAVATLDNRDHDFILGNLKIDVKSRATNVRPHLDNWDCRVPVYSANHQSCDAYVFTAIRNDLSSGWLIGWIMKDQFIKKARVLTEGTTFNIHSPPLRGDHYFLLANDLNSIETLLDGSAGPIS